MAYTVWETFQLAYYCLHYVLSSFGFSRAFPSFITQPAKHLASVFSELKKMHPKCPSLVLFENLPADIKCPWKGTGILFISVSAVIST